MDEKEKKETTGMNEKVEKLEIPDDVIVVDLDNDTEKKEEKKPEAAKDEKKEEKKPEAAKDEKKEEKKPEAVKDEKKEEKKPETVKDEKKEEKKPEAAKDEKKEEKKPEAAKDEKKEEKKPEAVKNEKKSEKEKDIIEDNEPIIIQGKPEKKSSKKVFGILFACFAIIILAAYVAGFVYFSNHFYQDVTINKNSVNGLDTAGARQKLNDFYSDYFLTIHTIDADNDIVINAKDIDMVIKMKDEFSDCFKKQEPYLWFVNYFKKYEFQVGADTSWSDDKLNDFYTSCEILDKTNMVKPEDAYVGVKDGKFEIVEEVTGNLISEKKFKKAIEDSLSGVLPDVDLKEMGCYSLPTVYADNDALKKELDAKNVYANSDIKIKMDDLLLEPGMELYDEILKKNGESYEVDYNLVKQYVKGLADEYDTFNKEIDFKTSFDGKYIKIKSDTFGYELDQELTLEALSDAIKSGKPTTVEAQFKHKGSTLKGDNEIGDSYIEVNLSEQRVVAYLDGRKFAEDDCVSGCESAGHGTCVGLYAIQDKLSPTVLRGERKAVTKTVTKKKNGKKVKVEKTTYEYEYESPVTYWMQFNGGIGLHDAAGWRSSYGGSIYRYNGSHGCVNLPYGFAEKLYKTYDIGTPVIVYFWDNEKRE